MFCSLIASLREGFKELNNPELNDLYCLGIGHVSERIVSRYQLALFLALRNKLKINEVFVYDPVLWDVEKEILNELGITVTETNLEGKYNVRTDAVAIFYLPHCPKQLTNNLLWSNWGLRLSNCIIISNSFSNIVDNLSKQQLTKNANYISDILPHTLELAVINSFKYYDVFNDTAIHMFPVNRLSLISEDFWRNRDEPNYLDDSEFVTNGFKGEC